MHKFFAKISWSNNVFLQTSKCVEGLCKKFIQFVYILHANTNKEIVNANICSKITESQQSLKSKLSNNHK